MKIFLMFILLFGTVAVSAQTKPNQCIVALQNLQIDFEKEKAKSESKDSQINLKDELITVLQGHITTLEAVVKNVDKQVSNNDKADALNLLIQQNLREELASYKQEVISLRNRVNKERRIGDIKAGIGLGAGVLVGSKF